MNRTQNYDYSSKILIIGDSGVGKTNILLRFCQNDFTTSHLTTIGIDFKIKTVDVDGKKIRLQIWDTAGQQRFKTITQTYYKGATAIIMTYAVNDEPSFIALEGWMKQIKLHASQKVTKVLVGNKIDCNDRQVSFQKAQAVASKFGVKYFEVSAKEGKNIEQVFMFMAKKLKQNFENEQFGNESQTKGTKITQALKQTKPKSKCC